MHTLHAPVRLIRWDSMKQVVVCMGLQLRHCPH